MELKQFKEAVTTAVKQSYELQKSYMKQKEDYQKQVNSGYLTQKFVDEKMNELKQKNIGLLNDINLPLEKVSREVLEKELNKIEDVEMSVDNNVYSELKLISEMKPSRELYQKYLDKYSNYPLAVEYIQELATKDKGNIIILTLPTDKRELLNILIQRYENYLTSFNRPSYNGYISQLETYANGVLQSIDEDYQRYISL